MRRSRRFRPSIWRTAVANDSGEPPLELPDALRATDCLASEVESVSLIQAHEVEPIERLLGRVAEVIGKCAGPFLEGDDASFENCPPDPCRPRSGLTTKVVNAPTIAAADKAWQARDYEQAE